MLAPANLKRAYQRVVSNKGAPGADGMTVDQLARYVKQYWPILKSRLLAGEYHPQGVRAVDTPKPKGGTRQPGIPRVVDRLIQQALLQQLTPTCKYWALKMLAFIPRCAASIRFLFVRPAVCLGLPSDSQSPATPLPLANTSPCRVCRGLSPPSHQRGHHSQAGCAYAQRAMPGAQTKKPRKIRALMRIGGGGVEIRTCNLPSPPLDEFPL